MRATSPLPLGRRSAQNHGMTRPARADHRWLAGLVVLPLACVAPADDLADDTGSPVTTQSDTSTTLVGESSHGLEDGESESDSGGPCMPSETSEVEACPEVVGEGFCAESSKHVTTDTIIEWSNNPPHSGDHFPLWSTKGEHEDVVERGNWVHNLEHGWIVLVYNCPDGCDAQLDVLREVIVQRPDVSILMTEDPLLDAPRFAAVAWTWVHEFDQPLLDELLCFVDQHWDHAPESVP